MESRFRGLLLACAVFSILPTAFFSTNVWAQEEARSNFGIQPQLERREIKEADIDSENFEVGVHYGLMNIEDFGTSNVQGFRFAYHVWEWVFVEALYGQATADLSSYERIDSVRLLTDDLRELTYSYITIGLNLLPGEGFIGSRAFNTALYAVGGVGSIEFAGDRRSAVMYGVGYRFLATDWLALHVDMRGHMFEYDLLGEMQSIHNFEATSGVTVFF